MPRNTIQLSVRAVRPRAPVSLEARLRWGLTVSLAVLLGGGFWLAYAAWWRSAETFVRDRLEHDAEALLGALAWRPQGALRIGTRHLTPIYHQPYSGHYFVVATPDGQRLRSRSLWDQDLTERVLQPGTAATWHATGPAGQHLLVYGSGYVLDGRPLTLLLAEDVTPLQHAWAAQRPWFLFAALAGLALTLAIQRAIVHRAFARLTLLEDDLAALEAGRTPALPETVPAEILPLVRRFNRLLAQFAQRLERSRQVAGNLGHALKGPLSVLLQHLRDPALPVPPPEREALLATVERLRQLAEHQLKRARLAGAVPSGAGARFMPATEIPLLIRLLERIHAGKNLTFQVELAPTRDGLAGDREDWLELLGNLLDNASKWARARVLCRLAATAREWMLTVEDDGPGCPEEHLARIIQRGTRLDEGVAGHGLGLAIVGDIVTSYGGHWHLERSIALGGLRVVVRLPRGDR